MDGGSETEVVEGVEVIQVIQVTSLDDLSLDHLDHLDTLDHLCQLLSRSPQAPLPCNVEPSSPPSASPLARRARHSPRAAGSSVWASSSTRSATTRVEISSVRWPTSPRSATRT